jgi:hypothetical protein
MTAGVEALVVALDGSTAARRWHLHITWSLAEDRAARDSNAALARRVETPRRRPHRPYPGVW